jgi:hypothetical protein
MWLGLGFREHARETVSVSSRGNVKHPRTPPMTAHEWGTGLRRLVVDVVMGIESLNPESSS